MEIAIAIALCSVGLLVVFVRWMRASPQSGADYVYVEDDGSIRDLAPDEIEYLDTDFLPNDGGRPYIKRRYSERTPNGRLGGYLPRRKVPRGRRLAR